MNTSKYILSSLIFCFVLSTSSCKRQARKAKALQEVEVTQAPTEQVETLQVPIKIETPVVDKAQERANKQVAIKPIDFKFLSGKGKVTYQDAKGEQNVNVSIRICKDSLIWISGGLMGIEGVRALVSQDSIKVLDRLNRAAYVMDFVTLSKQFNFDLNFKMVQSIFIGEMVFPQSQMDEVLTEPNNGMMIRQNKGPVRLDNLIVAEKLSKVDLKEEKGNTMTIEYADFQQITESAALPFLISTIVNYSKNDQPMKSQLTINQQKLEVPAEALSFPFSIPNNYKK